MKQIIRFSFLFFAITFGLGYLQDHFLSDLQQMKTSDERLEAVKHHIYNENTEDSEIVFVGSSRTMCNVIPELLELKLLEQGLSMSVVNLGVNWPGMNLQHLLIDRVLNEKKVKYVFLELPYLRRFEGHKNFRSVCRFKEAFSQPVFGNTEYLGDLLYTTYRQTTNGWNGMLLLRSSVKKATRE
jgi:hypothetical protein